LATVRAKQARARPVTGDAGAVIEAEAIHRLVRVVRLDEELLGPIELARRVGEARLGLVCSRQRPGRIGDAWRRAICRRDDGGVDLRRLRGVGPRLDGSHLHGLGRRAALS